MVMDTRINPLINQTFVPETAQKTVNTASSAFDDILSAAMDVIKETNAYQLTSDQEQIDFATGKTDDILSVLLAQEKAYSSLNFTTQVTNKIIESYREIMRMQI